MRKVESVGIFKELVDWVLIKAVPLHGEFIMWDTDLMIDHHSLRYLELILLPLLPFPCLHQIHTIILLLPLNLHLILQLELRAIEPLSVLVGNIELLVGRSMLLLVLADLSKGVLL